MDKRLHLSRRRFLVGAAAVPARALLPPEPALGTARAAGWDGLPAAAYRVFLPAVER